MPRIKIDIPAEYSFSLRMPVRITDLNYGNHLGNDRLLSYAQEARAAYFSSLGYGELDFGTGLGSIVADAAVVYKAEAFYGDVLDIGVIASDFHKYGFDLLYRVSNQAGKEVALMKTGILCFDYAQRKIALLPAALCQALGG